MVTGNFDVYERLIKKFVEEGDINVGAACRRWGFVRYYDTWASAHALLMDRHL